jgi:branched-chain amino acid transport system substrate-binding protein
MHPRDKFGFTLREFPLPHPGVEMRPQVLDIVRRYKADWVIGHMFGRAPSVSIKFLARLKFPMNRVLSLVWGSGEPDVNVADWDVTQGYLALKFAGVGKDHIVVQDIIAMY